MIKKKKEIDEAANYFKQQSKNEFAFKQMLKSVKPDLYVLFDILQKTRINPLVVWKTIRALNNIAIGNGYGTVTINVEKGQALFIRGEESDKVNEPLVLDKSVSL